MNCEKKLTTNHFVISAQLFSSITGFNKGVRIKVKILTIQIFVSRNPGDNDSVFGSPKTFKKSQNFGGQL